MHTRIGKGCIGDVDGHIGLAPENVPSRSARREVLWRVVRVPGARGIGVVDVVIGGVAPEGHHVAATERDKSRVPATTALVADLKVLPRREASSGIRLLQAFSLGSKMKLSWWPLKWGACCPSPGGNAAVPPATKRRPSSSWAWPLQNRSDGGDLIFSTLNSFAVALRIRKTPVWSNLLSAFALGSWPSPAKNKISASVADVRSSAAWMATSLVFSGPVTPAARQNPSGAAAANAESSDSWVSGLTLSR